MSVSNVLHSYEHDDIGVMLGRVRGQGGVALFSFPFPLTAQLESAGDGAGDRRQASN